MLSQSILVAAFAMVIPATQATWCNYYYDSGCQQDANGGTSFDCANEGSFGSGGQFVQCHVTKTNQQACVITRCSGDTCSELLTSKQVSPNGDVGPCTDMGGPGPWYQQRFA